jgi:peroxiredoxin
MELLSINKPIPESLVESVILKSDGSNIRFGDILNNEAVLLIFVRHFGCIGCTMQMNSIGPRLKEIGSLGIRTVVVGNGDFNYIDGFIERHLLKNKPIEIYTDPTLNIYNNAELKRSLLTVLGPRTWYEFVMAWSKGVGQKTVEGDNAQMGGAMLIGDDLKLSYYYRNKSVANHSDPNEIIDAIYKYIGSKKQIV